MLTDEASMRHTHSGEPMARMLAEQRPTWSSPTTGSQGPRSSRVSTVSIADVNDPALLVARAQGRTDTVVVMDDRVRPEDYWPCFQVIAARLP